MEDTQAEFEALCQQAIALRKIGRAEEALAVAIRAVAFRPNDVSALRIQASILRVLQRGDEAIAILKQAATIQPELAELQFALGDALDSAHQSTEAAEAFAAAVRAAPQWTNPRFALGAALARVGRLDDANQIFAESARLAPDDPHLHSNVLFGKLYEPTATDASLLQAHQDWWDRHGAPLTRSIAPHPNDRSADRKLLVGYVSPNFREHPISFFIEPVLAAHHREVVETICYSDVRKPDATTARIRAFAHHWRETAAMDDAALDDLIRRDAIDVLVDLTQHMASNRMTLFARKPAPVQACYLGYPYSTGLATMDYRLSDNILNPGKGVEPEKIARLESYFCYRPPDGCRDIAPATPLDSAGFVTFGSMNQLMKINALVLDAWCRVLNRVDNSRMLVKAQGLDDLLARPGLLSEFEKRGVAPDRIELQGRSPLIEAMDEFSRRVDVVLDTFPYPGGTTSCHLLWSGVPVVTIAGKLPIHRLGATVLTTAGFPESVARDPDEFVRIAIDLANNSPRRRELRSVLRDRMKTSALMDAPRFTQRLEGLYRDMWRTWCAG